MWGAVRGLHGFEQGDTIQSWLQKDGLGVQGRLEVMGWPRGTAARLRAGRREAGEVEGGLSRRW